jgi:hypothetical protein
MHREGDWVGPLIFLIVVFGQSIAAFVKKRSHKPEAPPGADPFPATTRQPHDDLLEALGKKKPDPWSAPSPVPSKGPDTRVQKKQRPFKYQTQPEAPPLPDLVGKPGQPLFETQISQTHLTPKAETVAPLEMLPVAGRPQTRANATTNARLQEIVRRLSVREEARWLFLCQEIFRTAPGLSAGPPSSTDSAAAGY